MLIFHNKLRPFLMPKIQTVAFILFIAIGATLSLYSYQHLPLIDFRPYKVGVNIPAAMLAPANAPTDKYETTFIYKKNGQEKEFTINNYPKSDSTWVFVDQKSVLLSKGYVTPIHDFSIVDSKFDDITLKVLENPGYTYLLIMYDLSKASQEGALKAEIIYQKAQKSGTAFYA